MNCPFCEHVNIEGADFCEQCGQPLTETYLHDPTTKVERGLMADRVGVLSPKQLIAVSPDTTVGETLNLMVSRSIGSVFVAEGEKVLGIFSERDALLRLNVDVDSHREKPISDFMTPNPHSLPNDAKVGFAVQQMDLGGYRHVPLVDAEGNATGVISVRDILKYLSAKMSA